jgi:glyoxylase-like metal-dependent hydrolase (beta-lactamase superfamily II)
MPHDSYRGDVRVGGPADNRTLPQLSISKIALGSMSNNCYLLECRRTGQRGLIDAADDITTLRELIGGGDRGFGDLDWVVTTHRHPDHWRALADLVITTGARTITGRGDVDGISVPTNTPVDDGDTCALGELAFTVISLAGHTPGGIALRYDDPAGYPHLFTGDSLFPGGVGNTFGSATDFATLIDDVEHKIFDVMPDDTWFYPGHGTDSTLGAERASIPAWRARGW